MLLVSFALLALQDLSVPEVNLARLRNPDWHEGSEHLAELRKRFGSLDPEQVDLKIAMEVFRVEYASFLALVEALEEEALQSLLVEMLDHPNENVSRGAMWHIVHDDRADLIEPLEEHLTAWSCQDRRKAVDAIPLTLELGTTAYSVCRLSLESALRDVRSSLDVSERHAECPLGGWPECDRWGRAVACLSLANSPHTRDHELLERIALEFPQEPCVLLAAARHRTEALVRCARKLGEAETEASSQRAAARWVASGGDPELAAAIFEEALAYMRDYESIFFDSAQRVSPEQKVQHCQYFCLIAELPTEFLEQRAEEMASWPWLINRHRLQGILALRIPRSLIDLASRGRVELTPEAVYLAGEIDETLVSYRQALMSPKDLEECERTVQVSGVGTLSGVHNYAAWRPR